jgi:hypothetical protein
MSRTDWAVGARQPRRSRKRFRSAADSSPWMRSIAANQAQRSNGAPAVRRFPRDPRAYGVLNGVLSNTGQFEAAESMWQAALSLDSLAIEAGRDRVRRVSGMVTLPVSGPGGQMGGGGAFGEALGGAPARRAGVVGDAGRRVVVPAAAS